MSSHKAYNNPQGGPTIACRYQKRQAGWVPECGVLWACVCCLVFSALLHPHHLYTAMTLPGASASLHTYLLQGGWRDTRGGHARGAAPAGTDTRNALVRWAVSSDADAARRVNFFKQYCIVNPLAFATLQYCASLPLLSPLLLSLSLSLSLSISLCLEQRDN